MSMTERHGLLEDIDNAIDGVDVEFAWTLTDEQSADELRSCHPELFTEQPIDIDFDPSAMPGRYLTQYNGVHIFGCTDEALASL